MTRYDKINMLTHEINLKIILLKFYSDFPGANELHSSIIMSPGIELWQDRVE